MPVPLVSLDALAGVSEYCFRRRSSMPVVAGNAPHHRLKPEFARNLQYRRTPRPKRRTKVPGLHPRRIGDGIGAIRELTPKLRARKKQKVRVGFRVICQQVSGIGDGARDLWTRHDEASDQEEGRFCLVSGKYFQQAFGMDLIRTI